MNLRMTRRLPLAGIRPDNLYLKPGTPVTKIAAFAALLKINLCRLVFTTLNFAAGG